MSIGELCELYHNLQNRVDNTVCGCDSRAMVNNAGETTMYQYLVTVRYAQSKPRTITINAPSPALARKCAKRMDGVVGASVIERVSK